MIKPITVDFETHGIERRPQYPPKPVGVAIQYPGKRPVYRAFAHPQGNTHTIENVKNELRDVWKHSDGVVFHNAGFDLDVAHVHLGLPWLPWNRIHDTALLGFLNDPNSKRVGLKHLAEDLLGIPPQEQTDLKEWILKHVPAAKKGQWAAHIWAAPVGIVGRYAKADVVDTTKLFKFLYPRCQDMLGAYDRDRKLIEPLVRMGERGIPVDVERLRLDLKTWEDASESVDAYLRRYLDADPDCDFDKPSMLADALEEAGAVEEWELTPTGKRKTSKDTLARVIIDPTLVDILSYRSKLNNAIRTFGRPWYSMSESTGRIYTQWNAYKRDNNFKGGSNLGARTGRISSTPNFQNVPRAPMKVAHTKKAWNQCRKNDEEALFFPKFKGVCPLPNMRDYIVPPNKGTLLIRDYNQQELRIFAHFEDGVLLQAYKDNVKLDMHSFARDLINTRLGASFNRKAIKTTGFGILYGEGVVKLSSQLGTDPETARILRNAYKDAIPGIKHIDAEIRERVRAEEPIWTWGGRKYLCEEPRRLDSGHVQTFEYKLLNTLVQGSAADCTKQAMVNFEESDRSGEMVLQVHDEIIVSINAKNKRAINKEMNVLKSAMDAVEFDVPMLSDGNIAFESWAKAHAE